MKKKTLYKIILVLLIVALISSIILSIRSNEDACLIFEGGCNKVVTSKYAYTFGIKNSTIGIFVFAFMFVLTLLYLKKPTKSKRRLIDLGIVAGSIIAIYFIYLQHFVIREYCSFCLIADISVLIALGVLVYLKVKK